MQLNIEYIVMIFILRKRKEIYIYMEGKKLLLNINLDPTTHFDRIFRILNYENFRYKAF